MRTRPPSSGEKISPCTIDQRPVETKGGHGVGRGVNGGHKVGGAGQGTSASPASVSNPFTVLRGPIVRLNSVLAAARAHASPDKEVTSKGGGATEKNETTGQGTTEAV
jgi:hypothetical protein